MFVVHSRHALRELEQGPNKSPPRRPENDNRNKHRSRAMANHPPTGTQDHRNAVYNNHEGCAPWTLSWD